MVPSYKNKKLNLDSHMTDDECNTLKIGCGVVLLLVGGAYMLGWNKTTAAKLGVQCTNMYINHK